jgi:Rrf2 family protein
MQLTRAADYAVRVMIHLAGMDPGARASRTTLAEAAECPEQFLSKVLQGLTRAGLIISHRGNTGGFELSSARRDATMLDVVEAIEGPLRLNVCLNGEHACPRQGWCPAHPKWAEAQAAMAQVLKDSSIEELARRAEVRRSCQDSSQNLACHN